LAEERTGPLDPDLLELLCEVVRRSFAEVDLGLSGGSVSIGVEEWVHFMMLRKSAPSHVSARMLHKRLYKALAHDPKLLSRLHTIFEEADSESSGIVLRSAVEAALRKASCHSAAGEQEMQEYANKCKEAEPIERGSSYEFLSHALGAEDVTVELALYDLSQGLARWVPPALLGGRHFEGVWHSGVRIFGKELWYGGAILESQLDDLPFGKPTRVLTLGKTLRTQEELIDFIRNDLYVEFNPRSYDVLRRNCNHFSNELVRFLLHGQQIPEEVLLQPQWARDVGLLQSLRPFLNRWLGGFGGESSSSCSPSCSPGGSPCTPAVVSRIDDLTEEWRSRLQRGDIVLHRSRFIDRPWVVRLLGVSSSDLGSKTADITFFRPTGARWEDVSCLMALGDLWTWEVVRRRAVPIREFYPLLDHGEAGVQILKAGITRSDARLGDMLRRPRSANSLARPSCPKGHRLQVEASPSWFRQAPPCSICESASSSSDTGVAGNISRMHCTRCNDFVVCAPCCQRGSGLPGGGVFADMLNRELAEALVADPGWLRFKARSYFFKADHNATGSVDRMKARRVASRLVTELGLSISQGADLDPVCELQRRSAAAAVSAGEQAAVKLDETTFVDCFGAALARVLDRLPPTSSMASCSTPSPSRGGSKRRSSASGAGGRSGGSGGVGMASRADGETFARTPAFKVTSV